MKELHPELHDWRSEWLSVHRGDHVAVLVPLGGGFPDAEWEGLEDRIRQELGREIGAPTLGVVPVDPYTGAGGFGLAFIWEVVGRSADVIGLVAAGLAAAPQVRKAARYLSSRFQQTRAAEVFLSASAIQALCIAEVCESGVEPASIAAVRLVEHKFVPAEPTVEKQQMYSAYTVTIEGAQPDAFYHIWTFLVTCHGRIVSRGTTKLPMPNASHWFQVELPEEKLGGLP